MKKIYAQRNSRNQTRAFIAALIAVIMTAGLAFGHGGKHSDKFTHLQALQKATKLFDQLVTKGKLDQSWENVLQKVTISKRKHEGKNEVVVSFERKEGDPKAVYIFLNSDGKYVGSNFTGE
jgi:hypothetical protein